MAFSKSSFFLMSLFLIPLVASLELQIVDEDYLEVEIGDKREKLKLLIDPVGHFTYIFKKTNSTSIKRILETKSFSNILGSFNGEWEIDDVFIKSDKEISFKLEYLLVTNKGDSKFNADGVIGLGYSDKVSETANIHKILGAMDGVLQTKNVMTYDKKHSRLVLGTIPDPDSFNPVSFKIEQPVEDFPINLVNLTKIGFTNKGMKLPEYVIEINQLAKLGLIPVIIAPRRSEKLLKEEVISKITTQPNSVKVVENESKFFDDVSFDNPNTKLKSKGIMMFGKIGYKFDHTWNENGKTTSAIRIGEETDGISYWYIGIDKLDVNRMDFDFSKNKVTLFSPTASEIGKTKYPFIFKSLGITIVCTIIAIILIRVFCSKKKQSEIKEGEELLEL